MTTWDVINSPIILTIVSFFLGGILASGISAVWQRRAQKHSVRLLLAQEILNTFHAYIRYLRRKDNCDDTGEFDRLHAEMLSKCTMAKVLFNKSLGERLGKLANKMATVQDLKMKEHEKNSNKVETAYEKNIVEAYTEAQLVIEEMFNSLK